MPAVEPSVAPTISNLPTHTWEAVASAAITRIVAYHLILQTQWPANLLDNKSLHADQRHALTAGVVKSLLRAVALGCGPTTTPRELFVEVQLSSTTLSMADADHCWITPIPSSALLGQPVQLHVFIAAAGNGCGSVSSTAPLDVPLQSVIQAARCISSHDMIQSTLDAITDVASASHAARRLTVFSPSLTQLSAALQGPGVRMQLNITAARTTMLPAHLLSVLSQWAPQLAPTPNGQGTQQILLIAVVSVCVAITVSVAVTLHSRYHKRHITLPARAGTRPIDDCATGTWSPHGTAGKAQPAAYSNPYSPRHTSCEQGVHAARRTALKVRRIRAGSTPVMPSQLTAPTLPPDERHVHISLRHQLKRFQAGLGSQGESVDSCDSSSSAFGSLVQIVTDAQLDAELSQGSVA